MNTLLILLLLGIPVSERKAMGGNLSGDNKKVEVTTLAVGENYSLGWKHISLSISHVTRVQERARVHAVWLCCGQG